MVKKIINGKEVDIDMRILYLTSGKRVGMDWEEGDDISLPNEKFPKFFTLEYEDKINEYVKFIMGGIKTSNWINIPAHEWLTGDLKNKDWKEIIEDNIKKRSSENIEGGSHLWWSVKVWQDMLEAFNKLKKTDYKEQAVENFIYNDMDINWLDFSPYIFDKEFRNRINKNLTEDLLNRRYTDAYCKRFLSEHEFVRGFREYLKGRENEYKNEMNDKVKNTLNDFEKGNFSYSKSELDYILTQENILEYYKSLHENTDKKFTNAVDKIEMKDKKTLEVLSATKDR